MRLPSGCIQETDANYRGDLVSGVLNNTRDGDQCCQLCRSVPTTLQGFLSLSLMRTGMRPVVQTVCVASGIHFHMPALTVTWVIPRDCQPLHWLHASISCLSDGAMYSAEARRGAMCGCGARSLAAARQGAAASPTWGASSSTRPTSAPAPRRSRCQMHGAAAPPQPLCQVSPAFMLTRQLACCASQAFLKAPGCYGKLRLRQISLYLLSAHKASHRS